MRSFVCKAAACLVIVLQSAGALRPLRNATNPHGFLQRQNSIDSWWLMRNRTNHTSTRVDRQNTTGSQRPTRNGTNHISTTADRQNPTGSMRPLRNGTDHNHTSKKDRQNTTGSQRPTRNGTNHTSTTADRQNPTGSMRPLRNGADHNHTSKKDRQSPAGSMRPMGNGTNHTSTMADKELLVPKLSQGRGCLGGWNAINPSMLALPGNKFLVALRGLCMKKKRYGRHVDWYSQLVVGTISTEAMLKGGGTWEHLDIVSDPRYVGRRKYTECQMHRFDTATGPEDPRLVHDADGKAYVVVAGYDLVPGEGRPECQGRGFLLYAAEITSVNPLTYGKSVRLWFDGMGMVEKNWAMFTPQQASGSQAYAVYKLYPHTIAKVNLTTGHVAFWHESYSMALEKLALSLGIGPESFHGGAGVASVPGGDYYISVFHCARVMKDRKYRSWLYKFSNEPPFEILGISKVLNLESAEQPAYGEEVSFVSTVVAEGGDLVIGYGVGDTSSHILRIPFEEVERAYFPRSFVGDGAYTQDLAGIDFNATTCQVDAYNELCDDPLAASICRACPLA